MSRTKNWQIMRKVLFKIPFFPLKVFHYAILSPWRAYDGERIIINFGPINWIFNPTARITFDFYDETAEKQKIWEPARGVHWTPEVDDDEIIEARLEFVKKHVQKNIHYCNFWKSPDIKPLILEEEYDLDENNCEHFSSYAVYGAGFSSQIDVFT